MTAPVGAALILLVVMAGATDDAARQRMTALRTWRARSASDRTDDWPFWYVTDDEPNDLNKTIEALETLTKAKSCRPPIPASPQGGNLGCGHEQSG